MKQLVLKGCGCLSTLLCLGIGSLYWLTRPTNVDWHKRSRDGISDLRAVHWEGKNLAGADLSGILFRESWLNEANFSNANLRGTDFSGATYIDDANLSNADLTGANLYGTYARRANFTGANLREAVLQHANLTGANLSNVDFAGADLSDATLVGARLTAWINPPKYLDRANLTDADLPNGYEGFPATRLCNTIMPNGNASKQGCLWPTKNLRQSLASKDWRWAG